MLMKNAAYLTVTTFFIISYCLELKKSIYYEICRIFL